MFIWRIDEVIVVIAILDSQIDVPFVFNALSETVQFFQAYSEWFLEYSLIRRQIFRASSSVRAG